MGSEPGHTALRCRNIACPNGVIDGVVRIAGERIDAVYAGQPTAEDATRLIDLGDQWLLPGLVDTHVHINDPGTDWEGWHHASRAAAAGGITTLVDMPLNSIPVTIDHASLDAKLAAAAKSSIVDYACWLGVVPEHSDQFTPDLVARAPGAKAFMCDSGLDAFGMADAATIEAACRVLAEAGKPLLVHAELVTDPPDWSGPDSSHAAWAATRPVRCEHDAVQLLARIAARTGAHIHVVHVSSADTPVVARSQLTQAQLAGSSHATSDMPGGRMTFETCPHYLMLAAEQVPDGAVQFKCAPPLQPAREIQRLWDWVCAEDVMVVSDHSPAPPARKLVDTGNLRQAWGGIASLQLTLSLMITGMREHTGTADAAQLARMMCTTPANLAGLLQKGRIAPGADADLVAVNPSDVFEVRGADLYHRWPLTPYEGMQLSGVVHQTWLRGQCIYTRTATDPFASAEPSHARNV
jgi:allantoinase